MSLNAGKQGLMAAVPSMTIRQKRNPAMTIPKFIRTNDGMIRAALKARLTAKHEGDDAVIVEELKVARGSGRIDLAVIGDRLEGIEIKSDMDSLSRLKRQADLFGGAADRMTVVTGVRHLEGVAATVPDWWRIVLATVSSTGKVLLRSVKRGRLNRSLDPEALTLMLEREELVLLLELHGLDSGIRSARYDVLARKAAYCLAPEELAAEAKRLLKRRAEFQNVYGIGAFGRNTVICRSSEA